MRCCSTAWRYVYVIQPAAHLYQKVAWERPHIRNLFGRASAVASQTTCECIEDELHRCVQAFGLHCYMILPLAAGVETTFGMRSPIAEEASTSTEVL